MEARLRRDFPRSLADEIVTDDTSTPTGFETLVATVREISKTGPTAVSVAFAAVAADHTTSAKLDELLYAHRGAGRTLVDRPQQHRAAARFPSATGVPATHCQEVTQVTNQGVGASDDFSMNAAAPGAAFFTEGCC
ncbi:hypothetical protein ACIA5G_39160 [Amycolatopsis sp. NPDC051758]|uniref:hypothetical protein n=1 Tax=Amycolatopsis sp. NPDC051758 TaxID=3363935 RepID=UPI00378C5FDD